MTTATPATMSAPVGGRRGRWVRLRRRSDSGELRVALGLGAFSVAVTLSVMIFPTVTPFSTLLIPVVVGSLLLGPRTLP